MRTWNDIEGSRRRHHRKIHATTSVCWSAPTGMEDEDSPAAAMSTILGKRKSLTTAGPDSGQLPASDALPGPFPAMQPAAAANTGEDDAESQDESDDEDTNQMSLADAQFEAELPARMQRFWDDELEVLQVRARMTAPRPHIC